MKEQISPTPARATASRRPRRRAMRLIPDPSQRRQLPDEGAILLWHDALEPGRREGLAINIAACANADCDCTLVHLTLMAVSDRAMLITTKVRSTVIRSARSESPAPRGVAYASVDWTTREVTVREDAPGQDTALVAWLRAELDDELVGVFRRRWRWVKGLGS